MLKQLSLSLLSICLSLVMVAGHLVGINLSAVSVAAQTKDGQLTVVPINSSEGRATAQSTKSTDRQSTVVSQPSGVPMVIGTTRAIWSLGSAFAICAILFGDKYLGSGFAICAILFGADF